MLVKFHAHTGAANDDRDATKALDYLLGEIVLKPDANHEWVRTARTRPPELLSGCPELVSRCSATNSAKHRYASGLLSFHEDDIDIAAWQAGDPAIRATCNALMRDFEETAFAGIPEANRPPILWIAHTDKDRLELNFLFPRTSLDGRGKAKAINPKPPKGFTRMWDAFRDSWNHREGWSDPEDPDHRRSVRLSSGELKIPQPKDADGTPRPRPKEARADQIADLILDGQIQCRDDVIEWFERQGYVINRTSDAFISVVPPVAASIDGPLREVSLDEITGQDALGDGSAMPPVARNAERQRGKPIRLRGDFFDRRFTSLGWLEHVGWFKDKAPTLHRDLTKARAALESDRARFAAHHARMLHIEPDDSIPAFSEACEARLSTDDAVPGQGDLIEIPDHDPAEGPVPEAEPGAVPDRGRPTPEAAPRLWADRYRPPHLDAAVARRIRYLDDEMQTVWLEDGSRLEDSDDRLSAIRGTDETIRLMIAQALARGWSGLNMRGDEAFLRRAVRLAVEAGMEMAGRDDAMDAIVQDERARLMAEVTGPAPEGAPRDAAPAGPRGEARDSRTVTRRRRPCDDARQPDHGTDAPPFTSRAVRFWQRLYGAGSLPNDLAPSLRQVDPDRGIITLTDGARLHDRDARIEASRTSAAAFRLVIAQARSKGWSGISIRGDEAFLRLAARIAVEENFPIEGRTPETEAIIDDEVRRCDDDLVMAAGDAAAQAGIDPRDGADGYPTPGDGRQEAGAGMDPYAEAEPVAGVNDELVL
jgi:hypothetical protein